jgi:hypothetical protein
MITVVTGLPRSGTSLAMQLLEAAGIPPFTDGQRLADTSNPQGYYEAEIVKTLPQDSAWLAARPRLPVLRLGFEACLADPLNSAGELLRWLELAHQPPVQQQLAGVLKQRPPQGPSGDCDEVEQQT